MQRLQCPLCARIVDEYCTINDRMPACPDCAVRVRRELLAVTPARVLRGAGLGALAALVMWLACGMAELVVVSHAELEWFGYLYAIGSVFTGALVGKAVSRGSGRCGGRILQAIAIGESLLAIAFALGFARAYMRHTLEPDLALGLVVLISFVEAPFLYASSMASVMPIAWVGFSVYDAWRRNKAPVLDLRGPFAVDQGASAPAAAPVAANDARAANDDARAAGDDARAAGDDARAAGMDFERPLQ